MKATSIVMMLAITGLGMCGGGATAQDWHAQFINPGATAGPNSNLLGDAAQPIGVHSRESRPFGSSADVVRGKGQDVGLILYDDFESYSPGTFPSSGDWTIRYNGAGNSAQFVTDQFANSGKHSLRLEGRSSWDARIIRELSERPRIVFFQGAFYSGSASHKGWFSLHNPDVDTWGSSVVGVSFRNSQIHVQGEPIYDYDPQQWYTVRVKADLDDNLLSVWVNDHPVVIEQPQTFPQFEYTHFALTAVNDGRNIVYFDDVAVWGDGEPNSDPTDSRVAVLLLDEHNPTSYEVGFLNVLRDLDFNFNLVDVAGITSGTADLEQFQLLIANTFARQQHLEPMSVTVFNSKINSAVDRGLNLVLAGASGAKLAEGLGLGTATTTSGWWPARHDSWFISSILHQRPILEGIEPFSDYQKHTVSQLESLDHEALLWRVRSGTFPSYVSLDFRTIEPDQYLVEVGATGFEVRPPVSYVPLWRRGTSEIVFVHSAFWTTDNDRFERGYIGRAGRKIISNAVRHYSSRYIPSKAASLTLLESGPTGPFIDVPANGSGYAYFNLSSEGSALHAADIVPIHLKSPQDNAVIVPGRFLEPGL